jgi:hypothetical protein
MVSHIRSFIMSPYLALTPGFSRCRKRERSGRWKASATNPYGALTPLRHRLTKRSGPACPGGLHLRPGSRAFEGAGTPPTCRFIAQGPATRRAIESSHLPARRRGSSLASPDPLSFDTQRAWALSTDEGAVWRDGALCAYVLASASNTWRAAHASGGRDLSHA